MRAMPANSVDLIATDPPYYKVKGDTWDNQWATPAAFLAWFDLLAEQWQRILKPNGSLYVFAWQKMAAHVEILLDERFNVLQRITWAKPPFSTKAEMNKKADQRSYFPTSEAIIFAEHNNPAGAALAAARRAQGLSRAQVAAVAGVDSRLVQKWEESDPRGQRSTMTPQQWATVAGLLGVREAYQDVHRPFNVSADVPYTDVWDKYPTVMRRGKHPCEKPEAMMADIIRASSRPGAVVLDCFMGSGVTGEAAVRLGRDFIGMEMDPEHFASASARLGRPVIPAPLVLDLPRAAPPMQPRRTPPPQLALFA